jgi:hypothetical protein
VVPENKTGFEWYQRLGVCGNNAWREIFGWTSAAYLALIDIGIFRAGKYSTAM